MIRRIGQLALVVASLCALLLPTGVRSSRAAGTPTLTPLPVPVLRGPLNPGPCDRHAIQPPAHLPGPHFTRTPRGIPIRLQHLPGNASISGLAVDGDRVAWTVQTIRGRRHSIRPRLYLTRLDAFHPAIVSSPSCSTELRGPYLSAHWLVWAEAHLTPFDRHDTLTIRAMSLLSGRTASWSIPYTSQVLPPGVFLSGDTLVWTRQRWDGQGSARSLVYGIYDRTLPDGPAQIIQEVREHIGRYMPPSYVDGYVLPRLVGNLLVWQRSRWQNQRPRTDIMAARLPHAQVRVLARADAESPVTNGWKVAWLSLRGGSLSLMQLDTHTGVRKIVGHKVLSWTPSPQLGGTTLSWQSGQTGQSWRLLLVRELLTGQQYTLVSWTAAGATPTPLKVIGPGMADGNRVVWQEIMHTDGDQTGAYLAIASIPRTVPPPARPAGRCVPPPPGSPPGTSWICT